MPPRALSGPRSDCMGATRSWVSTVSAWLMAMAEIGRPVRLPVSYQLRNLEPERFLQLPAAAGFVEAIDPELEDGDVLAFAPGPGQLHLAIVAVGGGIIHAHAGLRRVVHTPFPLPWPIIGHWRLA